MWIAVWISFSMFETVINYDSLTQNIRFPMMALLALAAESAAALVSALLLELVLAWLSLLDWQ
jgi:hypothetical protein